MRRLTFGLATLMLAVLIGCDNNPDGPRTAPPDPSVSAAPNEAPVAPAKGRSKVSEAASQPTGSVAD